MWSPLIGVQVTCLSAWPSRWKGNCTMSPTIFSCRWRSPIYLCRWSSCRVPSSRKWTVSSPAFCMSLTTS